MKLLSVIALVLAATVAAPADTIEELKAKAPNASPKDQVKIYAELAKKTVEVADTHFTAGDRDQGMAAVKEVIDYAEKSVAATRVSGKRRKQTEITFRKAATRLDHISRGLAFEDREEVEKAIKRLHELRDELLNMMFSKEEK